IMRISMSGTESKNLTTIIEAVRDSYLNEIVDNEYQKRLGRLELLKDMFAQYELGLKKKRDDLRTLANGLGSTNPVLVGMKQEFAWKELYTVQSELLQVQSQLRKTHLEVAAEADTADKSVDVRLFGSSIFGLSGSPFEKGSLLTTLAAVIPKTVATPEQPTIPAETIEEYIRADTEYDSCVK